MVVGGQHHAPVALAPKTPRTRYVGDWMGPRASMDGCYFDCKRKSIDVDYTTCISY